MKARLTPKEHYNSTQRNKERCQRCITKQKIPKHYRQQGMKSIERNQDRDLFIPDEKLEIIPADEIDVGNHTSEQNKPHAMFSNSISDKGQQQSSCKKKSDNFLKQVIEGAANGIGDTHILDENNLLRRFQKLLHKHFPHS
jgi:hypothetical protein